MSDRKRNIKNILRVLVNGAIDILLTLMLYFHFKKKVLMFFNFKNSFDKISQNM